MHRTKVLLVAIISFLNSPVRASFENSDTQAESRSLDSHQKTGIFLSESEGIKNNRHLEDCESLEDYTKAFPINIRSSWRCHDGVFPYNDKHPKPKFCNNVIFFTHCPETCGLCKGNKKDPRCRDDDGKVSIFFKDWPVKCDEGLWNNGSIKKDYCAVEEFR